jgi:predicted kinase
MTLYVVTGPPCGGKSTWVREHAKPGDIVADLDRLALAITSEDTPHHEYPAHIRRAAITLRRQLVAMAIRSSRQVDAYVIHAKPSSTALTTYRKAGAVFIECTAPLETLLDRARRERPAWVAAMIPGWWAEPDEE